MVLHSSFKVVRKHLDVAILLAIVKAFNYTTKDQNMVQYAQLYGDNCVLVVLELVK